MAKTANPIAAKFTFDGKDLEIGLTKAQAKLLDTGNAASALSRILRAQAQAADEAAKATGRLGASGHASVSGMQAASAGIRLLENPFGNNIRAIERLTTMLPGVSNLFKAAFPVVGAIAAIGVITELGDRVAAAFQKLKDMEQAPNRIRAAFVSLNEEQVKAVDDLDLTNVKLEDTIAKLEKRPRNVFAETLVEDRKRADELTSSIAASINKADELARKEQPGLFARFSGTAGTQDITAQLDKYNDQINTIRLKQQSALAMPGLSLADKDDIANKAEAEVRAVNAARAKYDAAQLFKEQTKPETQTFTIEDNRERMGILRGDLTNSLLLGNQATASDQNKTDEARLAKDQAAKEAEELAKQQKEKQRPLIEIQQELDRAVKTSSDRLAAQKAALQELTPAQAEYAKAVGMAKERNDQLTESLSDKRKNADGGSLSSAQRGQLATGLNNDILAAQAKLQETINAENGKALELSREKLAASERALTTQFASLAVQREEAGNAAVLAAYESHPDLNGTVADEIRMKAMEEFDNKVKESNAQQLHDLALQIAAQRNLNAAKLQGAEFVRAAQLQNRFGEIDNSNASPQQKQALKDAASLQSQMSRDSNTTNPWITGAKDQLENLNRTLVQLDKIRNSEEAIKEIEMERGKLLDEMALKMNDVGVGLHVALSQMADDVQTSSKIARDSLMQLQTGVNDTLAKVMTGQKTGWAKMFQSDGESLIKKGLGNLEGSALKSLGFGSKADGSSGSPFYVKVVGFGGSGASPSWIPGGSTADGLPLGGGTIQQGLQGLSGGGGGGGGFTGIFSTILKSLFAGFHADGGTIGAGQWGIVGEQGPEAAYGGTTGLSITPNGKGGSGQITYQIDARGADAAQVEARVARAIAMSHQSSVSQSLAARKEQALRRPRGT